MGVCLNTKASFIDFDEKVVGTLVASPYVFEDAELPVVGTINILLRKK